jgi:hypothetical protein
MSRSVPLCRVTKVCAGSVPGNRVDPAQRNRRSESLKISLCQVCQVFPIYELTEKTVEKISVQTTMAILPAQLAQAPGNGASIRALTCDDAGVPGVCRVAGTPSTPWHSVTGGA